jgi:hypothetical protein
VNTSILGGSATFTCLEQTGFFLGVEEMFWRSTAHGFYMMDSEMLHLDLVN